MKDTELDWLVVANIDCVISVADEEEDDGSESLFSFESIPTPLAALSNEEGCLPELCWSRDVTPLKLDVPSGDAPLSFERSGLEVDISPSTEQPDNTTRVDTETKRKRKEKKKDRFQFPWPSFPWYRELVTPISWMRHTNSCGTFWVDGGMYYWFHIMRLFVRVPIFMREQEQERPKECEENFFWVRNHGSRVPCWTPPSINAMSLDSDQGGVLVEIDKELYWWRNGSFLALDPSSDNKWMKAIKPIGYVHETLVGNEEDLVEITPRACMDESDHHHQAIKQQRIDPTFVTSLELDLRELKSTCNLDETEKTSVSDSTGWENLSPIPIPSLDWPDSFDDDCIDVYHC